MFADDAPDADLIETLWNVKVLYKNSTIAFSRGFNRDIVECKACGEAEASGRNHRFNRDIVECKVHHNMMMPADLCGFNRYIVECKEKSERFLHNI